MDEVHPPVGNALLHLELQKNIMPLLTAMFPNIQFIVTSHSPFILNSLKDVVIYDLENKVLVEGGLQDVPYDGTAFKRCYVREHAVKYPELQKYVALDT